MSPRQVGDRTIDARASRTSILLGLLRGLGTAATLVSAAVSLVLTGLFWFGGRQWASVTCPSGADGSGLRLDRGGWGDPSWCRYGVEAEGPVIPAVRRELTWFEPLPLTVITVLVVLVILTSSVSVLRGMWVSTDGQTVRVSLPVRAASIAYAVGLGIMSLFMVPITVMAFEGNIAVALGFASLTCSTVLATYLAARPPGAPRYPVV